MDKELNEYYMNEINRMKVDNEKDIRYKQEPFIRQDKQKRNDNCSCGSGLKYKRCCMLKGVI